MPCQSRVGREGTDRGEVRGCTLHTHLHVYPAYNSSLTERHSLPFQGSSLISRTMLRNFFHIRPRVTLNINTSLLQHLPNNFNRSPIRTFLRPRSLTTMSLSITHQPLSTTQQLIRGRTNVKRQVTIFLIHHNMGRHTNTNCTTKASRSSLQYSRTSHIRSRITKLSITAQEVSRRMSQVITSQNRSIRLLSSILNRLLISPTNSRRLPSLRHMLRRLNTSNTIKITTFTILIVNFRTAS